MPVKYIDVSPISDLFVPATRSFGDIAIVGKGGAATAASPRKEFTNPADALAFYPATATVTLTAATGAAPITTLTVSALPSAIANGATITLGTGAASQVLTLTVGAAQGATSITVANFTPSQNWPIGTTVIIPAAPGTLTPLAAAIAIAFRQTPPPTTVWGVQVDEQTPDWDAALLSVQNLDVQIVVLASTPLNAGNVALLTKLTNHVVSTSNTGGDGKERIGVAMLDSSLTAAQQAALNTGGVKSERMFLVAHKSSEDAAAAVAGVIAGYEPHISMLLKPIHIAMTDTYPDGDIDTLNTASVNWITSPVLIPGHAFFLGEGYTADPSQNKKYIDIVRTIDDVNFRIKAALIQTIGNFRVSRTGLRGIVTIVQSVLSPLVARQVIEDYTVYIPLLVLLDKDPNTLSAAEQLLIQQHQADRTVDMTVTVVYAGAIHRLKINLVFK